MARDKRIVVTAHRDGEIEDPKQEDLYTVGTLAELVQSERQQSDTVQVVLEGICRVRLSQFDSARPFYTVAADELRETDTPATDIRVLMQIVNQLATKYADTRNKLNPEVLDMIQRATEPGHLADLLATQLLTDTARRQELLEQLGSLQTAGTHRRDHDRRFGHGRARAEDQGPHCGSGRRRREYYLREQLKAIHDELSGEGGNEIEALRTRILSRGVPKETEEKLLREVTRLERMPSVSAEATVVRTYLDTLLSLPWSEETQDRIDLDEAEAALNDEHFGLDGVKERILDFWRSASSPANRMEMRPDQRGDSCVVGPPGVGKTSLGRSIATSMGRE